MGLKEIKLKLKNKAYQLNLSTAQIMNEIRNRFYGFESQRLQIGTNEVKIWIRYNEQDRNSIYDLENIKYLSGNILLMIPPSLTFFICLPLFLDMKLEFYLSVFFSITLTAFVYWVYLYILGALGINLN